MSPRLIGFAAVALIIAQVLLGFHLFGSSQVIPLQKGMTTEGKIIDLINPAENHLTLVSFWASNCKPCVQEMPDFLTLYNDYSQHPLDIVGVVMPYDQLYLTLAVLKHFQVPWPNVPDLKGKHIAAFGDIQTAPTVLLLNHSGEVLWKKEGLTDFKQLRQQINQHLPRPS